MQTGVYVWRYAVLVVHARNDENDDLLQTTVSTLRNHQDVRVPVDSQSSLTRPTPRSGQGTVSGSS